MAEICSGLVPTSREHYSVLKQDGEEGKDTPVLGGHLRDLHLGWGH